MIQDIIEKKKKIIRRRLIGGAFITLTPVFFLMFFIMLMGSIGSTDSMMPKVDTDKAEEYKQIGSKTGIDWAQMMVFDTVRYENDLKDVDPNKTAFDFLIVEYKKYKIVEKEVEVSTPITTTITTNGDSKEVIIGYDTSTQTVEEKKLDKEDNLYNPQEINNFLTDLGATNLVDGDVVDIVNYLKEKDESDELYEINIDSKDIRDLESKFTNDQLEWANVLLAENAIYKLYGDYIELPEHILTDAKGYFAFPTPGIRRITSPYGWRSDPFNGTQQFHSGIDIADVNCYGTPVIASAPGKVIAVSYKTTGYGYNIKIEHTDPEGNQWETRYAHLAQINVEDGEKVDQGDVIGAIGSTGKSTGAHLHFEIKFNGQWVDPLLMIGN